MKKRFVPNDICGLQVREDENGKKSREVVGRAIAFGVRSVNLTPWSDTHVVYEVLEPGCLTQELINRSDVVYNLNHNNDVPNVLGRFRNSQNDTLKLELREDGLYTSCELPETNNANDALVLINRGDINGQSFAFEDDYEDTENGVSLERTSEMVDNKEVWIRHVKRITGLYDVAIVTHPAYEQTSVGTREASDQIEKAIEEALQRECGDKKPNENECGDDDEKKKAEEKAKEEEEQRQLEEQAQRAREQQAFRMRARAQMLNNEIQETLNY